MGYRGSMLWEGRAAAAEDCVGSCSTRRSACHGPVMTNQRSSHHAVGSLMPTHVKVMSGDFLSSLIEQRSCADCVLKPMCRPALVRPDQIEILAASVLPRKRIPAGTRVYEQGAQIRALFVSQGGVLKTELIGADGQLQVLGFHFPGELMGLEALDRGRFRASAVAVEPVTVCEIPVTALERVASRDAGFQHQLMRAASSCVSHQQDHLELLSLRQADERIALFLLGMLDRLEAASGKAESMVFLPMNRTDIASYLCLTIETVSRSFTRLRDAGVISVDGRQIGIRDRDRLATLSRIVPCTSSRRA